MDDIDLNDLQSLRSFQDKLKAKPPPHQSAKSPDLHQHFRQQLDQLLSTNPTNQ